MQKPVRRGKSRLRQSVFGKVATATHAEELIVGSFTPGHTIKIAPEIRDAGKASI
jgi:hypothetical protein